MKKYVLGLDIGGTNTRMGLVDQEYHLADFQIVKTAELQKDGNTLENFIAVLHRYLKEQGAEKEIVAISAGFPSTLDRSRRQVLSTPNIKGFSNMAIVDRLEEEFHLPACIETDVDMLILFDMFANHIPEEGITCGFYFGTGLGNAIVINGELLVGKTGAAAELGHIPVRGVKGSGGCGNESCMEIVACGHVLSQICKEKFPEIHISDVFVKCAREPEIIQFVDDLAAAVATEINILDPDYIILGGGLTQMPGFPFRLLEECIYKYARKPFPARELCYIYSKQAQENGVIGAGILGFKKFGEA